MTDPASAIPTLPMAVASTEAQSIVDNAQRLGLTWELRPATVQVTGTRSVAVLYDGDTVTITAISLVGPLIAGMRVYVIHIPPSGNFIVGFANDDRLSWLDAAAVTTTGTLVTTVAAAESDIPQLALLVPFWQAGYVYEIITQLAITVSVTTDDFSILVRRADDLSILAQATFSGFDLVDTPLFGWPVLPSIDERAIGLNISIIRSAGTGAASVLGGISATRLRTWSGIRTAGALTSKPGGVWRTT